MQKTNKKVILEMENVEITTFYNTNNQINKKISTKQNNKKHKYLYIFSLFTILSAMCFLPACFSTQSNTRETRNLLDLIDYFDKHNLKSEQVIPTQYHILHASDGCALVIEGTKVEFYIYDIENPNQKKKLENIIANKSIKVLAYTIPVEVNGGIVMLVYSKKQNMPKIIKVFKQFPYNYKSSLN
jgi:hypothetical protein